MLHVVEAHTPSVQSSAPVQTTVELRRELADANANCEAADAAARQAKATPTRQTSSCSEAADNVQRLKTNLDALHSAPLPHTVPRSSQRLCKLASNPPWRSRLSPSRRLPRPGRPSPAYRGRTEPPTSGFQGDARAKRRRNTRPA